MTWSNTSLIPVPVLYETGDIPRSYLPYTRQKLALDLIPVPDWCESFLNVPDTSTCQVWKEEEKRTLIPGPV
jgi:hypothetical protein